jgi:hypothetical protein
MILADLPYDHPLRNTKLIDIGAEYLRKGSKVWTKVTPSFGIAKVTYNQLGEVWTNYDIWRATNG